MTGVSIRNVSALALLVAALAAAQQTSAPATTTAPAPTTPTAPTTTPTGPAPNLGTSSGPSQPRQPRQNTIIFITGNVALPDGTEPPERVQIERICSANRVRPEGYTDSKGRFSLQLGQSLNLVPDASDSMFMDATQGFGNNSNNSSLPSSSMDPMLDCELRAKLAGYRSTTILLAGRRSMDNPEVGTIVIFPINGQEGEAVSATSANAPKEARKAFEKGSNEARKKKWENAEKELRKAVDLHPKYAEAWVQLGKVYSAQTRLDDAKVAFQRGIEADPKYVYPYDGLYKVAFNQGNWQEVADTTDKLLRLNPYEFPEAYYYNGVAQMQLNKLDLAEQSLQRAMDNDKRHLNPKILYVMGLVQVQKRAYPEAIAVLSNFVEIAPKDPSVPKVQQLLEDLRKAR